MVYRFTGGASGDGELPRAGLIDVKGTLYGTTALGGTKGCYDFCGNGTVYSVTTAGAETVLYRFSNTTGTTPEDALVNVNGALYGTASSGGTGCHSFRGCGTIFRLFL